MAPASEEVLLSTSDLSACDLPARLVASPESLNAIKAALDDIRAEDVVLSELLNRRGPAAWLAARGGDDTQGSSSRASGASRTILQLAQDCVTLGQLLVLPGTAFDLVCVPRPACAEDGVAFAAFATRVEGVRFISQSIAAKQVAVILDLDGTLLESEHLPIAPMNWHSLPWESVRLKQQPSGQQVAGRVCPLPPEPHHAEAVHAATWVWKGAAHNYRVRQRLGWGQLRDLLIQENYPGGKLATYVLSLGRPLYIQTAWQILDPAGQIIPHKEFSRKINSARPDGIFWVPEKTPCIGVGLRSVFDQDFNMSLGPVFIADDLPEVYAEKYRGSVFEVEAYKPVSAVPNDYDDGSVLRGMAASLLHFWEHCYGPDGQGGAVAAVQTAAQRTLHQLTAVPLEGAVLAAGGADVAPGDVGVGWDHVGEALFKGQADISSALLVKTFVEQRQASAALAAQLIEPAVPEAEDAVPENNENAGGQEGKGGAMPNGKPSPAAAQQHVLRPSSRQDHCASDAPPAQPATAGSALLGGAPSVAAATLPSAPHADAWWLGSGTDGGALAASGEEEGEEMETRAAVSIVPAAEDGGIGESRLVLLLGSGPARAAGQGAGAPACGVVEAAAAQVEGAAGGGVPVEEAVGLRLAHEVHIWGSAEDGEVAPGLDAVVAAKEAVGESGEAGRKRDFDEIAGHDTLMGPGAPPALAVST